MHNYKILFGSSITTFCLFICSWALKAQQETQDADSATAPQEEVQDAYSTATSQDYGEPYVSAVSSKSRSFSHTAPQEIQGVHSAAGPQVRRGDYGFTVSQSFSHTFDSDVKDGGSGDVNISRAKTDISYENAIGEGKLNLGFNYEYSDYDFSRPNTLDDTEVLGLAVKYSHKINEEWGVFGRLGSTWAYETDQSSMSDSQFYTISAGASYAWNEDLKLYFGLTFLERFEDNNTFLPLIGILWKIDERWTLKTANGATLFYDLTKDGKCMLDFGVRYEWRQYRLEDGALGDGRKAATVEKAFVGFAGLTHHFTDHFSLRGFFEISGDREFTGRSGGHDRGDVEADPAATVGLSLNLGF